MGRINKPWYRKSKKCWYVNINGRQKKLSADKTEAYRLWHAMMSEPQVEDEVAGGNPPVPAVRNLSSLIEEYLTINKDRWKKNTYTVIRSVLRNLQRFTGDTDCMTFDASSWMNRTECSRTYRRNKKMIVLAMYRNRKVSHDPFVSLRVEGPESAGDKMIVSKEDHEKMMKTVPPQLRDIIEFLRTTGCRPLEAVSLTFENLSEDCRSAKLIDHKTQRAGKDRIIVVPRATAEMVMRRREEHKTGRVFRSMKSDKWNRDRLFHTFKYYADKAGVSYTLYGYRHTFATDALIAGIPDTVVAALLGHSSTVMIHKHYSHVTSRTKTLTDAVDRLNDSRG